MRYLPHILFLLIFLSCKASQNNNDIVVDNAVNTPYILNLKTVANEPGVTQYKIYQSSNNRTYSIISTFMPTHKPDSNNYVIQLPQFRTNQYIIVRAFMLQGTYSTNPIFIQIGK